MATKRDLKRFAADLPTEFLVCRARRGHTLGAYTVVFDGATKRYLATEKCALCETQRTQKITPDGYIDGGSTYLYPKGYLAEGLGFIDTDGQALIRLERIKRALA